MEKQPKPQDQHRQHYSKAEFWDERYVQKGGFFDWYAEYPELKYSFQTQYGMTVDDSILMIGCGNSKLSQQMYDAGYKHIVNIDISPAVIKQMKEVSPDMQWLVMDATAMTFETGKFDFVIDKGTMDALIAGRDLTPSENLLKECMRVTKQEGQLILITYGSPQGRKKVFENALSFNVYDYYFAYVNLNDMSTMINLMRNNLIGPNGERIDKQVALQKSLKEFMMIKVMRKRRSRDKQFVVWEDFMKKNSAQQQQQQSQPVASTQVESKSQNGNKEQVKEKIIPTQQNTKQTDKQAKTQPQPSVKYMSKQQKQTYVYAYSLKRKFGYDFDVKKYQNLPIEKQFKGADKLCKIQVKGQEKINRNLNQVVKYLQEKQIAHSTVKYIKQNEQFCLQDKEEIVRLHVKVHQQESLKLTVLKKTNVLLKIQYPSLGQLNSSLEKLGSYLIQRTGLKLHPCPKSYSLVTMLRGRMNIKTSDELLKKYWYPTYKIQSVDCSNNTAVVNLSIAPIIDENLEEVKNIINQFFNGKKQLKVNIQSHRSGFISYPDLKVFNLINMASLSYNKGKKLVVQMDQFWTGNQAPKQNIPSDLFNIKNNEVYSHESLVPRVLMHFLALY